MAAYCIVETDAGMVVVEIPEGVSAEDAAEREAGVLIEAGPFWSYDDAYDALLNLDCLQDEGS